MMELRKFTLVSNNTCYGPCPEPDEEVEQRLTLAANGRVWFSGYNFGHGFGDYEVGRKLQVNIGSEAAGRILDLLDRYFDCRAIVMLATDVGSWELTMTDTAGEVHKQIGSLCEDLLLGDTALSATMRELIPIDNLFIFDGNYEEEPDEDY